MTPPASELPPPGRRSRARSWLRALELMVVLGLLGAVVAFLWEGLTRLPEGALRWPPGLLVGWTGLGCLLTAGMSWLSTRVYLRALGTRALPTTELALALAPRVGKYLPGRIHSLLGLVWLAHRLEGIPPRVSTSVGLLQVPLGVGTALIAAAALLPRTDLRGLPALGLALAGLAGLGLLHPALCLGPMNWLLARLGRDEPVLRVRFGAVLRASALIIPLALLRAACFAGLAHALLPLPAGLTALLALSYLLAVTSGFVAFFAPAGLGVQEGALWLLLSPALPPEQAAVLTLAARLWNAAIDLVLIAVGGAAAWSTRRRLTAGRARPS